MLVGSIWCQPEQVVCAPTALAGQATHTAKGSRQRGIAREGPVKVCTPLQ